MSRCFPFPPPGYEKKAKIDETDLLAKEKHKEKKHKKDKKDKDKKEKKDKKDRGSKEKKDKKSKDRSKEKHKEKRDKKEKHKDKDKSKERDRDKDKDRSSDSRKSEVPAGSWNGEKVHPNKFVPVDRKDSKHVQELAKRIRDVDGASRSQLVENVVAVNERKADSSRTINEPERSTVIQVVQKVAAADDRKIKFLGPDAELSVSKKIEEKVKESKNGHHKEKVQENHVNARVADKLSVNLTSRMGQERIETLSKPSQNEDPSKQIGGKEKNDHKERDVKGERHKHKDRDRGKDSKSKVVEKEKKGDERVKSHKESSNEQSKLQGNEPKLKVSTKESLDFRNAKPSALQALSTTNTAVDGNLGKRKEPERNGYLYDVENRPNKCARSLTCLQPASELGNKLQPASDLGNKLQPVSELGNKLQLSQTGAQSEIRQGLAKNIEILPNDAKANGFLSQPIPSSIPTKPPPTQAMKNANGESSFKVKPPHPDMKYLNQILTIPTMDDVPDSLDQEWLFPSDWKPRKKQNLGTPVAGVVKQVWSEAMPIESADIIALPYVIPY